MDAAFPEYMRESHHQDRAGSEAKGAEEQDIENSRVARARFVNCVELHGNVGDLAFVKGNAMAFFGYAHLFAGEIIKEGD